MKAKICGIRCLEDAVFAEQSCAWAIGFNFYRSSLRYIAPEKARQIADNLPDSLVKVGIFIDAPIEEIKKGLQFLDYAQVYQHLPDNRLDKKRCILSMQAELNDSLPDASILEQYAFILLDAPKTKDGLSGGTGRQADWELAQKLAEKYRLILAGGLNCQNVLEAIAKVKPYAVDVASGVELTPGMKNPGEVHSFLMRCKHGR